MLHVILCFGLATKHLKAILLDQLLALEAKIKLMLITFSLC